MEKSKFKHVMAVFVGGVFNNLAYTNDPSDLGDLDSVDLSCYMPLDETNRRTLSMVYPSLDIDTITTLCDFWQSCSQSEIDRACCDVYSIEYLERETNCVTLLLRKGEMGVRIC